MKKKVLAICIVLILVLNLDFSSAFAAEQAELGLELKSDGTEYAVSVRFSGTKDLEMIQFKLEYDGDMLTLRSVEIGEVFRGRTLPTISNKEAGSIYLVWDDLTPLDNGTLMQLHFTAKDDVSGTAWVGFDEDFDTVAADGDFNEITLNKASIRIPIAAAMMPDSESDDAADSTTTEDTTTAEPETSSSAPSGTGSSDGRNEKMTHSTQGSDSENTHRNSTASGNGQQVTEPAAGGTFEAEPAEFVYIAVAILVVVFVGFIAAIGK